MSERPLRSTKSRVGFPRPGLTVGQAVEVNRGSLAELTGVLIGFERGQNCIIQLHVAPEGVVLVIDAAAVQQRPMRAATEGPAGGPCSDGESSR
jgi:hypothetical protein